MDDLGTRQSHAGRFRPERTGYPLKFMQAEMPLLHACRESRWRGFHRIRHPISRPQEFAVHTTELNGECYGKA